jgi:hypothetical protein
VRIVMAQVERLMILVVLLLRHLKKAEKHYSSGTHLCCFFL